MLLEPAESVPVLMPAPEGESREARMLRLAKALIAVGVSESQTRHLLIHHDLEEIERQLAWLPARKARRKSSLIVSAIKERYEKPANLLE